MTTTHDTRTITQVGPGGDNSWAVCTCGWEGRTRYTHVEASTDAATHLESCATQDNKWTR